MAEGVEGLLRDKTRPSRIPPLGADVSKRMVRLTLEDPPGETTHWTADAMARAAGSAPPATTASRRPRSAADTVNNTPVRIPELRTPAPSGESPKTLLSGGNH